MGWGETKPLSNVFNLDFTAHLKEGWKAWMTERKEVLRHPDSAHIVRMFLPEKDIKRKEKRKAERTEDDSRVADSPHDKQADQ